MMAMLVAVFAASLLGSVHCAGMCGPFVAFAVGQPSDGTSRTRLHFAYHGGRLVTYMLLGAAAGAAGALLDLASSLAGLQPIAMALAGTLMIGFGVAELLRQYGRRVALVEPPRFLAKLVQRGQRVALKFPPTKRALAIGLLTTLLPCGWLYAFAITAAGTGSAAYGALVMALFWTGTLPILISVGVGTRALLGTLGKRMPLLCALALIIVGTTTLVGRASLTPAALAKAAAANAEAGAPPDSDQVPACCQPTANP